MSNLDDEAERSLEQKRKLYNELEASMKSDEDETPDTGRLGSLHAIQKGIARKQQLEFSKRSGSGLPRSISDTSLHKSKATSIVDRDKPPSSSDPQGRIPARLKQSRTFAGTSSKAMVPTATLGPSKAVSKRKREASIKEVPAEYQVFKGLNFYFFPNNDANPARKMRITKAIEFGATWKKGFDESITHVIVDKTLDYNQLVKFLKKDRLPSNVVVVSENYPAECISFRTMLDPLQRQFKVKGYELPSNTGLASEASDKSLQLKPAGRSVQARRPETPATDKRAPTPPTVVSSDGEEADSDPPIQPIISKSLPSTKIQSTEELDIAIRQARNLQHVPLDNEDDPASRPSSSEGPTTDEEQQGSGFFDSKKKTKLQRMQDRFQCMQKHTGTSETPNAATVAILQQMADYYNQIGDEWRTRAYRKAIATLRNHLKKVWTREEALALPQIGERLAMKIEEIAFTNRLRRLDNARAEPSDQIMQTFMQVYGVGYAQARKWVNAGYTTLDELLQKAELSNNQRIGIEHFEDFNSRIPRAEVEQHGNIVRKTLQKIDPAFEVIVGGSYRRGSETSGDIDCIITRPDTGAARIRQVILDQLVPELFAKNFLVAELAATSRDDGSKWHGASTLPTTNTKSKRTNPWRRIDFLLVPSDELGAALIYFTGNDIFNRSLRLLASTKGMRLNQRGLYKDVIREKGREKLSEGTLVEGRNERRIFEVLGVPWRPSEHRIP